MRGFLLVYLKTIEAVSFPIVEREGLKEGILCSGMIIVVFFEILRAVFCAVEREGLKNVNLGSFSLFMGIL